MCQNGGISPFGEGGADKTVSPVRIRLPNYYFTKYVLVKASRWTKYMYIVVCISEPHRRGEDVLHSLAVSCIVEGRST